MSITTERNNELVQRLYELVGDISIVERALLRFDQEFRKSETLRESSGKEQLERLLFLLASEQEASAKPRMVSTKE
jgi:hypothetical protein